MGLPAELPKVIIDLKCQLQPNNEPWVKEAALKRIINFFPEPSLRPGRDSPDQIRTVKKIIDGGIVPLIKMNVISGNRNLVLLALEVLQNLTAGTLEQLHAVVDDELWHQFSRFLGIPRMPTSHQDKTQLYLFWSKFATLACGRVTKTFPIARSSWWNSFSVLNKAQH